MSRKLLARFLQLNQVLNSPCPCNTGPDAWGCTCGARHRAALERDAETEFAAAVLCRIVRARLRKDKDLDPYVFAEEQGYPEWLMTEALLDAGICPECFLDSCDCDDDDDHDAYCDGDDDDDDDDSGS